MDSFQIAIDGPVAAGKSTVSHLLADRLGFLYIDTGAMYRALALQAKRNDISWENEEAISQLATQFDLTLRIPIESEKDGRFVTVCLGSEDVSLSIRTPEIGEGASIVSQYQHVRQEMVRKQRELADDTGAVVEGRDIGLRVLPHAKLKIYLDASVDERVKRYHQNLTTKGIVISMDEARGQLMRRDQREMTRAIDPLQPVADAWIFDTTGLSINEVTDRIFQKAQQI